MIKNDNTHNVKFIIKTNTSLILIMSVACFVVIASIFFNLWSLFFFVIFLTTLVIVGYRTKSKNLFNILLLAFFVRVFISILYSSGLNLPDSNGDAWSFQTLGWEAVKDVSLFAKIKLYPKIIALIYFLTGKTTSVVSLLNVFLGILVVVNTYYISLFLLNSKKIANRAALMSALFPTFVLYSVLTLREMPAIFFASLSFLTFLKWLNKNSIVDFVWGSVFILIAMIFHGIFFLALPGYIILLAYLLVKKQKYRKLSIVIVVIFIILLYMLFPLLSRKVPVISLLKKGFSYLDITLNRTARGGSAYLKNFYPHSIFDLIWMTPVRMIYFLFGPFPWIIHKAIDIFGIIDGLCYIMLFYLTIKSINISKRLNSITVWFISIVFLTLWVGLSWGTSNFGTAIRHRTFLAWIIFPFAAVSLKKVRDQ